MTRSERLFVRVDATPDTGLGHFNRCLAIAQCWRETMGPVTFIGQYPNALTDTLQSANIDAVALSTACPDTTDIDTTTALIPPRAAVVLDGYHFVPAYQEQLSKDRRLLVIDDTGQFESYSGSILLNANIYADTVEYADAPAQRLLGLRYALLRREFVRARSAPALDTGAIQRVLVCLGGADAANDTLAVLQAMQKAAQQIREIRVVAGPLNPHIESLQHFAESDGRIEICRNPRDMCAELRAAEFVIAGAGTTTAELACLGKPSLLFAVADNQLATGPRLEQAGAAIYGGDMRNLGPRALVSTIDAALMDTRRHESMRATGPALVDGQGAARICSLLSGAPND